MNRPIALIGAVALNVLIGVLCLVIWGLPVVLLILARNRTALSD